MHSVMLVAAVSLCAMNDVEITVTVHSTRKTRSKAAWHPPSDDLQADVSGSHFT